MKQKLLLLFLLCSILCSAQEVCNNGIDDDGDGKIDLNDSDCICNNSAITSIIPNASFETLLGCPSSFSQLNNATPWIQATQATTDYFNTCGFMLPAMKDLNLLDVPDGKGLTGALFLRDWNEYLGTTLLSPMKAGTDYQLTFNIASLKIFNNGTWTGTSVDLLEPVNVTLYGCNNGANLPLNIVSSPNLADPTWIEIGHASYVPVSAWGEITISFTPTIDVNAIMLGSPPVLPASYPSMSSSNEYPYFLYDNLLLNTAAAFGVNITQTGNFCDNNLVLKANLTTTVNANATYQWYHNGIAIIGETKINYNVPSFESSLGNYTIKVTDGSNCFTSTKVTVNNTIPGPTFTSVQPTCIVTTGSIKITSPAQEYSFDNGATWQTNPQSGILKIGTYYIRIKTPSGCISSATGVTIVEPQLLGASGYTVEQPATCDATGTITITSPDAVSFSFDNGDTWTTNPKMSNLQPGSYFIKIKDAVGCQSASQNVIINRIYLDYPIYSVVQPVCGTGGTISISTLAAQYSFDDGLTWTTNPIATNLTPGYYAIKIKNSLGCESFTQYVNIQTFYLSENPTYTRKQPVCGDGGTITITNNAAEYSFDGGSTWTTNPVATNLPPGYYYIMYKNDLGCISYSQYVSLDYFYLPQPTYTFVQPICGTGGSITITTPAAQYSFDGGTTWSSNATASNLASGTYYVMIKNSLGCVSNYQYVNLNPFYLPDPTFLVVNPSCGNIGSITITTPAAQYSFDGGNTWTANPVATNLQPGTYYLKIKNTLGCESNYVYVYLDSNYLAYPNYSVIQPGCGTNGSITITTVAAQYSFDNGNTWTTNPIASNLSPGYYYILIKNNSGCVSSYLGINLETFYLPNPNFTVIQPNCGVAGKISITTTADLYSFDNGATWTTNPIASNLQPGYYYILIKNNLGCISNYQYTYIEPFYLPNPTFTVTQPICGTGGTITITTTAAQYSFDNGTTWTTNPVASNLAAGTYYILIKNNLGCVSNYQYASINTFYLDNPTFSVVQPTCGTGGTITITTVAAQYSFDNGTTWTTNPVASNLAVGTYYILIKNNLGCVSNYQYVNLNAFYLDNPTYTVVQPSCGIAGSISITTIADQYSFDNGSTWTSNPKAINLLSGYYYIKIKNALGCQSNTQYVYINYSPIIPSAPLVTSIKPTACGTKSGSITITSYAANYSFDNGATWVTTPTLNSLEAGTYLVRTRDNYSGCPSEATTVVLNNLNSLLIAPTYSVVQPTCSINGTITITTAASQYSFDNGITFISSNSRSNLSPGIYLIKIKNSDGCISDPASVTISTIPTFKIQSSGSTQSSCAGELTTGIEMHIDTPAAAYSFDNGVTWSTTSYMTNLKANTEYCLRIKNAAGCISEPTCTTTIQQIPVPNAPLISVSQPISCSAKTGTITVTTLKAEYSFDDGVTWSTNPTSKPLLPGTYFIRTREFSSSCVSYATTTVINAPPNAPASPSLNVVQPISCVNPFGTIDITSTAFQYSFDNGITYSSNSNSGPLAAGTYQIKVKNSSNCESNAVTVKINAPTDYPNAPATNILQPDCSNPKGIITVTSVAAKYSFDNGVTWSTNPTSGYLNSGSYLVKIKNTDGCISEASTVIIIPFTDFPPVPTATSPQTFCIQQNATIKDIAITGQNVKWYNSLTAGTILLNTTSLQNGGTYYTSQTVNGCESKRNPILINIQDTPKPIGSASQTFCSSQNPTLDTIVVSGTAIKWYTSTGVLLSNSTPLQDGAIYYASQTVIGCESTTKLTVTVSLISTLPANNYAELFCDDLNDGSEKVNLSDYNSKLISNASTYNFSYYSTFSGAENQFTANQIVNFSNYNLVLGDNKIYVRINSNNPCNAIVELKLTLLSKPIIPIQDIVPICENNIITIDAGSGYDTYLWSNGVTTASIQVANPGDFSVTVTNNYSTISCSSTKNFKVKTSTIATITSIDTQDWTDNQNMITVYTSGTGDFEYSIDGIHFQDSNQFSNIISGQYTIHVRDKNGCGTVTDEVYLLMYPKFFTPNGDGYNDTWKIKFSDYELGITVKIFDRYGKFIKELFENASWDGMLNGHELPATDYWFVVTRASGKEYRGHFSLKR
ncbi:T9SS type B sorting domain-containing protein [Flavobacterium sp. AED]|uniref:T9SS type B sorting domain-containing protein n=1 Tax=Flavobacterium sp. AED TaxID=1423323 RepID=UPI00057C6024|nr:T9SS type B sorting domain-containing protein [Flavobacterium sp. AED]KIA85517.1 hypothetical protein OA85_09480 [Flavobacterium sp. AED]